jgi:phage-related tail protein
MVVGGALVTAVGGIVGSLAMLSLTVGAVWRMATLALAPLRLTTAAVSAVGPLATAAARAMRGMALALMLVQGGPLAKVLFVVRAIGAALLANPIGLVVAAFVGAALLIRKYWEPISGFCRGL